MKSISGSGIYKLSMAIDRLKYLHLSKVTRCKAQRARYLAYLCNKYLYTYMCVCVADSWERSVNYD